MRSEIKSSRTYMQLLTDESTFLDETCTRPVRSCRLNSLDFFFYDLRLHLIREGSFTTSRLILKHAMGVPMSP